MAKKNEILKIVAKKDREGVIDLSFYSDTNAGELLNIYAMLIYNLLKSCPEEYREPMLINLNKQVEEYVKDARHSN